MRSKFNNFCMNYFNFGCKTIVIDLKNEISKKGSVAWKSQLCISLKKEFQNIIYDVVYSFSEITIFFKQKPSSFETKKIILWIKEFALKKQNIIRSSWEIPICFDHIFSEDLLNHNKGNLLAFDLYIKEFVKCEFEVHHYGFLPGFFYSTGLPNRLHIPRKMTPVKSVDTGTLAVGDSYVGIYPQLSPGGWNRIGKTYYSFFKRESNPPCFILPGDKIKFNSISLKEYKIEIENFCNLNKIPKSSYFEIIY
ncbi:MAG: hypothetical protein CMD32_03025 [Flavobacteriales bacterium]|nr:hypothetical protein [Flavobacteriales bacterium]